jgi:hypothetical protein
MSYDERQLHLNPFCQAFPTEVSCTVPNVGAGGGPQVCRDVQVNNKALDQSNTGLLVDIISNLT